MSTILIVDDEQAIRKSMNGFFSAQGYKIYEAENGIEALNCLSNQRVDIMISDIMMPRMDGVELLREVRKQYPMVRVIMITGQVKLDYALSCMRKGADDCIFKPFTDLNELNNAVADASKRLKRWRRKLEALSAMKDESE